MASSTALIGFGLDSVIEVASAAAVAWQFSGAAPEARERAALKVIAVSFFALAAYVTVESIRSLTGAEHAEISAVGHRAGGGVAAGHALALLCPALRRTRARLGQRGR